MGLISIEVAEPLGEWVRQAVANGSFPSASDYIADLIRRDRESGQRDLDEVRAKIAVGVEQLRAGDTVDGEEFMTKLLAELAELERQGG